jgi:hypothetical protein
VRQWRGCAKVGDGAEPVTFQPFSDPGVRERAPASFSCGGAIEQAARPVSCRYLPACVESKVDPVELAQSSGPLASVWVSRSTISLNPPPAWRPQSCDHPLARWVDHAKTVCERPGGRFLSPGFERVWQRRASRGRSDPAAGTLIGEGAHAADHRWRTAADHQAGHRECGGGCRSAPELLRKTPCLLIGPHGYLRPGSSCVSPLRDALKGRQVETLLAGEYIALIVSGLMGDRHDASPELPDVIACRDPRRTPVRSAQCEHALLVGQRSDCDRRTPPAQPGQPHHAARMRPRRLSTTFFRPATRFSRSS